jgi:hypothetical protein
MAHNEACARSQKPAKDCDCSCRGRFHGVNRTTTAEGSPEVPKSSDIHKTSSRRRNVKRAVSAAAVVTVTGVIGGLTITGSFDSPSDGSSGLSVQVNVDLKNSTSALSGLGFGGKSISSVGISSSSHLTGCAASATGQVRQFLTHYPCEQYAADTWTITKQGSTTQVVFSWVEMPTTSLAEQYKGVVDTYSTGNPPGVSPAFKGHCYASGQQDSTVWTVEIQPTENLSADRAILQAAARQKLAPDYLGKHCVA